MGSQGNPAPWVVTAVITAALCVLPNDAHAQMSGNTAQVLPGGLFRADVNHLYVDTRDRIVEGSVADGSVDPETQVLMDLVGASSDFGDARVRYRASAQVWAPSLFYGITDRFTVGLVVPVYQNARVDVRELKVGTGSIGYNPDFASDPRHQSPILGVTDERAVRGAAGIQRLLTDTFEYEPIESWSASGLGDIQTYGRASLYNHEIFRSAIQSMVTIPTGRTDDINNLVDFGLGSGQVDVGAIGLVDFLPAKWLVLNVSGGYIAQLRNKQQARVFNHAEIPIAPKNALPDQFSDLGEQREVVRNLGDIWQVGGTSHFKFGMFVANAGYTYASKGRDSYRSTLGEHPAMGVGTAYSIHSLSGMLGLDFVQSFLNGSFPLPIGIDVTATNQWSNFETANMMIIMSRFTLYFGSADSAKNAKKKL